MHKNNLTYKNKIETHFLFEIANYCLWLAIRNVKNIKFYNLIFMRKYNIFSPQCAQNPGRVSTFNTCLLKLTKVNTKMLLIDFSLILLQWCVREIGTEYLFWSCFDICSHMIFPIPTSNLRYMYSFYLKDFFDIMPQIATNYCTFLISLHSLVGLQNMGRHFFSKYSLKLIGLLCILHT